MELALTVTLLRLPEVEKATGLKKSAIYSRIKEGPSFGDVYRQAHQREQRRRNLYHGGTQRVNKPSD